VGKRLDIDWGEIFSEYLKSGESKRDFCKEKGIGFSTFCKYFSKCKHGSEKQVWIEAKLSDSKNSVRQSEISEPALEISAGKFKISLSQCNEVLLAEIIGVIGRLC
jgi:hypothetical protein